MPIRTEADLFAAIDALIVDRLQRVDLGNNNVINEASINELNYLLDMLSKLRINQGRAATLTGSATITTSITDVETTPVIYQVGAGNPQQGFLRSYWKTDTNPPTLISQQLLDTAFAAVVGGTVIAGASGTVEATYNATAPTLADGATSGLQLTERAALKVYHTGRATSSVTTEHVILTTSGATQAIATGGDHHEIFATCRFGTMTVEAGGVTFNFGEGENYERADTTKIPFSNDITVTVGPQVSGVDSEVYVVLCQVAAGAIVD